MLIMPRYSSLTDTGVISKEDSCECVFNSGILLNTCHVHSSWLGALGIPCPCSHGGGSLPGQKTAHGSYSESQGKVGAPRACEGGCVKKTNE